MLKKLLSIFVTVCLLTTISTVIVSAESPQNDSITTYDEVANNEKISVFNEFLGKNITYVKWNDEWAAVIDTKEDLEKYLYTTKTAIEQAMNEAYNINSVANKSVTPFASSYSNDVLVRRVSGTFNFDCRCSYTVTDDRVTSASAYGVLTGFTFGVRYDETFSSANIINYGTAIDCFISGTITNYVFFEGVGDIYTCTVTSGGYVYLPGYVEM